MQKFSAIIIDDEAPARAVIRTYLKECIDIVVIAEHDNAFDGLNAIDEKKPNLVFLDIQMPKMNGYEATREIKKIRKTLPVIAQTAYAMAGDREKSIQAGCDDYITKPLNIESLLPKINQFISPAPKTKTKAAKQDKNLS